MRIRDEGFEISAGPGVRKEALDYAKARMQSREASKRIGLAVVALLGVVAGPCILFAPEGRECVAYGVAAAIYAVPLVLMGLVKLKVTLQPTKIQIDAQGDQTNGTPTD